MTVSELIAELQRWPGDLEVHLDVSSDDDQNWEGDRVVRSVAGLRHQSGYYALAIDANSYNDTQLDQKTFLEISHDITPVTK